MTCALLLDTLRQGTGGVASALDLAEGLAAQGFDVWVVVIRYDPGWSRTYSAYAPRAEKSGVRVLYSPGAAWRWDARLWWLITLVEGRGGKRGLRRVARRVADRLLALRAAPPELEQILSRSGVLVSAAGLTGFQVADLRRKIPGLIVLNHAGSPVAFEEHWLKEWHRPPGRDTPEDLYTAFLLSFDLILCQLDDHARACASRHQQLQGRVITIRPTCDEIAIERARQDGSPYPSGAVPVAVVGTIQSRKGQLKAVRAFARLAKSDPMASLQLVGDDQADPAYTKIVKSEVRRIGLQTSVSFQGHRRDYLKFLVHAAVLLVTSEAEGIPRVVREAMAAGVPVVGFELDGFDEVAATPGQARWVTPGDLEGLSNALIEVAASVPERRRMAELARTDYEARWSREEYERALRNFSGQVKLLLTRDKVGE